MCNHSVVRFNSPDGAVSETVYEGDPVKETDPSGLWGVWIATDRCGAEGNLMCQT